MNKKYYKTITFFLLFLCLFLGAFSAHALEVKYPETITGSTITSTSDLAQYLKYIFDAGMSLGLSIVFLTFVVAGVFYFLSPVPGAIAKAKDMLSGAISGLLILLLTYIIITTINPSLSVFKTEPLEAIPTSTNNNEAYGVNIYKSTGCSDLLNTYTSDAADMGEYKNKAKSAKIMSNPDGDRYISVLFSNLDFSGKCQYIFKGCQSVNVNAISMSVDTYNSSPSGSGYVKIYRKSLNDVSGKSKNKDGGYLKITQADIGKSYETGLANLKFTGSIMGGDCTVPDEEQKCIKWSKGGICQKKECPSLDGGEISSIEISGDYLVLLTYLENIDSYSNISNVSVYTYCQLFPTKTDVNKTGPEQIKWDPVSSSGRMPNHILIMPIK